jgi:hypothetical protein
MTAQMVLIIAGLALIVIAILGKGEFVKVIIPALPLWARICLGIIGTVVFVLAFMPEAGINSSPANQTSSSSPTGNASPVAHPIANPASSGPSSPIATAVSAATARPSVSITIQDPHNTGINYLHDVPGKITDLKPYEEVWILIDVPGNPKLYPQGSCDIIGEGSFTCANTRFGDPGVKGTFYAQAIIVNAAQDSALRKYYDSGLTSMPHVVAESAFVRYTKN